MKIGDRCFVHGYIDEIRKDTVIIRNEGGYFGTDPCEVIKVYDNRTHPNWISVENKLPDSYVDVLVWFEYYRYGSYNRLYRTHGIGTYSENYDSWTINHESGWHKLRVIAWMPLPEPYQPKEESE